MPNIRALDEGSPVMTQQNQIKETKFDRWQDKRSIYKPELQKLSSIYIFFKKAFAYPGHNSTIEARQKCPIIANFFFNDTKITIQPMMHKYKMPLKFCIKYR